VSLLERLGVEHPVVQAGMGGGIARAPLAAAVSQAGGLGTVAILPPDALRAELRAARERTERPVAVNLLLPFTRPAHWDAVGEAALVVTFWGRPVRRTDRPWAHQVGSVEEARAAHAAGADAVIAQGVEAGGHVRGTTPALALLERVRAALPAGFPVLVAGGIADGADARRALDAGAEAVVAGTRFLLSEESGAHPGYVRRLLGARATVRTELFGQGWPGAPHRVVPNAATARWLRGDPRGPRWVRAVNRVTAPVSGRVPLALMPRIAAAQRPGLGLFTPQPPAAGLPATLLDAGALYAGETVARIDDVRPAAELVAGLAGRRAGLRPAPPR
jgi:NAD(P)H-dependent flavin oxidoreductase YrpB (nitropropane dioxygenase family)